MLDGIKHKSVSWDAKQDRERAFLSSLAQSLGDNEAYYAFDQQIVTAKLVEQFIQCRLVTHAQGFWHSSKYKLSTNFIGHQEVIDDIVKSVVSDLKKVDHHMYQFAPQIYKNLDTSVVDASVDDRKSGGDLDVSTDL